MLVVLLVLPACSGCNGRLVPPMPGPSAQREAYQMCDVLETARQAGLSRDSLFVDVGAHIGSIAMIANAHGHAVVSFECRLGAAHSIVTRPWWTPNGTLPRLPASVKLVSTCVSDHTGLGGLYRALDSSSMTPTWNQGNQIYWKARRDGAVSSTIIEAVPVVRLDDALSNRSLTTLGLPAHVGFIKSDTNGNDRAVMRGAAATLREHKPVVYFERSGCGAAGCTDKGSSTAECALLDELGLRGLGYSCFCDDQDCLWFPAAVRINANKLMSK